MGSRYITILPFDVFLLNLFQLLLVAFKELYNIRQGFFSWSETAIYMQGYVVVPRQPHHTTGHDNLTKHQWHLTIVATKYDRTITAIRYDRTITERWVWNSGTGVSLVSVVYHQSTPLPLLLQRSGCYYVDFCCFARHRVRQLIIVPLHGSFMMSKVVVSSFMTSSTDLLKYTVVSLCCSEFRHFMDN